MSPEERQLLSSLFDRIHSAANTPRDTEAEQLIADAVRREPAATYYLAQAVIVQEKGLEAAAKRIEQLEAQVRQLETQSNPPVEEQRGGFLSSIFGSSQPPQARPMQNTAPRPYGVPQPGQGGPWGQAPDPYAAPQGYSQPQPTGPWSQAPRAASGGSSFLTGALGTAAGVAGGMLLANSLSGIFGHHMSGLGLGNPLGEGFGTAPVEETVINNFYGDAPGAEPVQNAGLPQADAPADPGIQQADYDDSNDWNDDGSDFGGDDSSYA